MLKMSKRFADSDKYKKGFIRNLPAAYKIFWDYICLDCNHAGIWQVDFEVAQIYIGQDAPVDCKTALELFNQGEERIIVLNGGSKWFIQPFIDFQYGALNPENRVHFSVLKVLNKYEIKHLVSSLQGAMDKNMDKNMIMDKDKDMRIFDFWNTKDIIKHKIFDDKTKRKVKVALDTYSEQEVIDAINNYSEVIAHPEAYFFSYRWTLADFLQRGLARFLSEAKPLDNFKIKEKISKLEPVKPKPKPISTKEMLSRMTELELMDYYDRQDQKKEEQERLTNGKNL